MIRAPAIPYTSSTCHNSPFDLLTEFQRAVESPARAFPPIAFFSLSPLPPNTKQTVKIATTTKMLSLYHLENNTRTVFFSS